QLSAHALAALAEFQTERDARAKHFEDLKLAAEAEIEDAKGLDKPLSITDFEEDWNHSQFWACTYNDTTAIAMAKQLLDGATDDSKIAVVSTPSVFVQLKNLLASSEYQIRPEVKLLEYDERFGVFSEFVPYDLKYPTRLPPTLKGQFDRIIYDPPFLSVDCQTKIALTVRWLAKSWEPESLRLIAITGERMEGIVHKLCSKAGIRTTDYAVEHANGLSNEFLCYANFESDEWAWEQEGVVKEQRQDSVLKQD
ncbi:uncharacterized protein K452DRAFT_223148, partial [Aplosporella prunicola CBS 121167]